MCSKQTQRSCAQAISLLAAVILISLPEFAQADESALPNFIIIFTDDQGYNDLGCFGSPTIATPNIDQMAREGVRLTDFYAQPVCGVSRAALMTGCYPIRVAEPGNRKNQHTILHPDEVTMAEVLHSANYTTACIGKWHLGRGNPDLLPNAQGFDYFYGTPAYNGFTVLVDEHVFRSPLMRNREVIVDQIDNWNDITRQYTEEAIAFMRTNSDRPFFLYLAHNMPHIPLGASEPFRGRNPAGPYADAIEEIDWSTGEILAALKELELDERTLVVFTSDNGPWIETTRSMKPDGRAFIPAEHAGNADPLRGYKMLTWEGGLRVPCVMRWPGEIPSGRVCSEIATTMDLLPTFARLAGAELPAARVLDGEDIWPMLTGSPGTASPHDAFYYYCFTHLQAVRSGRWKLVLPRPEHPEWVGWSGRFVGNGVEEIQLFDLHEDVAEEHDVAEHHPDVVERLLSLIEVAREDLGDYDRIGDGARFFDDGPRRPESQRWTEE